MRRRRGVLTRKLLASLMMMSWLTSCATMSGNGCAVFQRIEVVETDMTARIGLLRQILAHNLKIAEFCE